MTTRIRKIRAPRWEAKRAPRKQKRRGQAVVEMALVSVLLGMMLAAAIDFGRAFYTAAVVTNMAGEGAAYAAIYPDREIPNQPGQQSCSIFTVDPTVSIQERARRVAKDRGLIIERGDQQLANIEVYTDGYGYSCSDRCPGRTITVRVTYTLDDLFLPGMLGTNNIRITRQASQLITGEVGRFGYCAGTP
jgi:Flp pilus assembly protein TadG